MFGKKKKNEDVIDESKLNEDNEDKVIEGLDEDLDKKEIKEIEKKKKKAEEDEIDEARDEILNSKPKTKVGKAFKMYQFIIKIIKSSAEDVKFVAIVLFQFLDKMKSVDMPLRECLITRYY